jgi:type IV secretion system protein VirD4
MSNLLTWYGSAIVVDPKGELATNTAQHRAEMGQDIFILDPFHEVKGSAEKYRAHFNPLDELHEGDPVDIVDNAAMLADAVVMSEGGKNEHFSLSAKNLLRGLMLYALDMAKREATLNDVRELVTAPIEEPKNASKTSQTSLMAHFRMMMGGDAFDGVLASVGSSMIGKPETERGSIISTAIEQTSFLDSLPMRDHLAQSGLPTMRVLKRKPTTIYLVLPSSRFETHSRWLRSILTLAMTALEREENATKHPVLFVLEEFPTLGYMRLIEASAGLMAGYDVKLWTVLQDLSQIQAHYPKSWETFLGNAGYIEAFGNTDLATLEYLSKRLGNTLAPMIQPEDALPDVQKQGGKNQRLTTVTVPLLAPYEIAQMFSREKQNKLVLMAGEKPCAIRRVFWKDLQ